MGWGGGGLEEGGSSGGWVGGLEGGWGGVGGGLGELKPLFHRWLCAGGGIARAVECHVSVGTRMFAAGLPELADVPFSCI